MEREIEKLIETLKRMTDDKSRTGAITGSLAGKSIKDQKEFQKQLEATIETMKAKKKLDDEEIKNLKDINKEFDKAEESVADFSGALDRASGMAGPFVKTMFKLGDGAASASNDLAGLAEMFKGFGLAGDVVNALAESLDYNVNVFRELSQVGASFGKSLIGMREMAHSAMLPLGEFAGLVADNALALSSLFGTTEQGVKNIAQFSLAVRDKALQDGLYNLGITTEELNEYMGTYLERQRFAEVKETLTAQQVADRTTRYAKQLDLLAKVTGIQRKQIDDAVKQQQKDALLQKALTGLTEKQKTEANLFLGALENMNPALAANAKMMMESGVPFDEMGEQLMGLNPELADLFLNFKGLIRSGKSSADVLAMMAPHAQNFIGEMDQIVLRQFPELADAMQYLATQNMKVGDGMDEQARKAKELTDAMMPFNEEMRRLKVQFATLGTEFLKGLTPAIIEFKDFIVNDLKGYVEKIVELIKGFSPANFGKALMAALAGALIFDFAKQVSIVAMGTAIGIGKGGKMVSGMFKGKPGKGGAFGSIARGGIGRTVGVAGVGMNALSAYSSLSDDDKSNNGSGIGTIAGTAIGGLLGLLGGPAGVMLGASLGGMAGGALGNFMQNGFNRGTMGTGALFQDFGRGTPAMLHGMEAVVTPSQLRDIIDSNKFSRNPAPYDPGKDFGDYITKMPHIIKDGMEDLIKKMPGGGDDNLVLAINNLNKTLNTNNMIASMIERNTKSTNTNLANMGSIIGG
jgi:hypothetical protein